MMVDGLFLKKQKEIDKYIHLVPFSNVLPEFIEIYPEYKSNPNPNINGDQAQFYNYWNANVAIKKVNVIVLHNHAGADGLIDFRPNFASTFADLSQGAEKIRTNWES
ncbi:hypothetical protein [Enterocloster clostridioformis]|jgi:hypothetical protein|uniref:hypothetical protein n=1 Tax=Enterocloster clostridioformis TaxID=1531 RepID=UPI00325BBC38